MIELLSEEKLKSYEYLKIQLEYRALWDKVFLSKDKINKGNFSADQWLQSNQLFMTRAWEYPWVILNSNISAASRILDVGSGISLFPPCLATRKAQVYCIDTNEQQMTVIAPAIAEILQVQINYSIGDALNLAASDNTFDYVCCVSVLEHLEQEMVDGIMVNKHAQKLDRVAIKEYLRVIKPHGKVFLTLDYGSKTLPKNWLKCSFEYEYIEDLVKEFSSNLLEPVQNLEKIKLTPEKEDQVVRLWSEFYPYLSAEKSLYGTALGIILTK